MTIGAVVSEARGIDGTGFFATSDSELITEKSAVKASEFYERSEYYRDSVVNKQCQVFVGHNRNASVGTVNTLNTQPYVGDEWAIVHNGTMTEAFELATTHRVKSKIEGESDTEAFFRCVEKKGFVKEILAEVECYSMVAMNFANRELLFARDLHRPMCIMDLRKTLGVRVFCSTKQLVQDTIQYTNAAGLTNIKVKKVIEVVEPVDYDAEETYEFEHYPDVTGVPAPATAIGNNPKRVVHGE